MGESVSVVVTLTVHAATASQPFGDVLFVEFFLLERADISIELFDLKGAVGWRPIHQQSVEAGQHLYDLSLPDGLPTGAYRAVIRVDGYPFVKLLLKG